MIIEFGYVTLFAAVCFQCTIDLCLYLRLWPRMLSLIFAEKDTPQIRLGLVHWYAGAVYDDDASTHN